MGAPGTTAAAAAGEAGTDARSDPLGGAVGGDEGIAGTLGKENIPPASGNCGAAVKGTAFSPSTEDGGELDIAGTGAGAGDCGTSGVTPAREATIARKSVSVSALVDGDKGSCRSPETEPEFGTKGEENISRG